MCMYVCMCMRVVWSGLVFSVNNIVHDFSLRGAETPCPLKLRKKHKMLSTSVLRPQPKRIAIQVLRHVIFENTNIPVLKSNGATERERERER